MTAKDVITSYVADVARLLPRKQRHDVALELSALLHEEIEGKAESAGRAPDAALAREVVVAFGRPADVAARYQPALVLIDPADARAFVRLSVIGVLIQWVLGFVAVLRGPIATFDDVAMALGPWWLGVAIPSLWWPGFLVVGFAFGAWARRRWPRFDAWSPRPQERERVSRVAYLAGVAGMAIGIAILLDPMRVLDLFNDRFLDGRAARAAYDAFTYDPDFLRLRAPLLLSLLIVDALLHAVVAMQGRWTAATRRFDFLAQAALAAVMAWIAFDGRVLVGDPSNDAVKGALTLFAALMAIGLLVRVVRERQRTPRWVTNQRAAASEAVSNASPE